MRKSTCAVLLRMHNKSQNRKQRGRFGMHGWPVGRIGSIGQIGGFSSDSRAIPNRQQRDTCVGVWRGGGRVVMTRFNFNMKTEILLLLLLLLEEEAEAGRQDNERMKRKGKDFRGKRTDQDGGLRRRAILFKLKLGPVLPEGVLDEGAAEADDGDAAHDDEKGEPLVKVEAAVEKDDREDADEEDECATCHLEDRDWGIEQANVHQLRVGGVGVGVGRGHWRERGMWIAGREKKRREGRERQDSFVRPLVS